MASLKLNHYQAQPQVLSFGHPSFVTSSFNYRMLRPYRVGMEPASDSGTSNGADLPNTLLQYDSSFFDDAMDSSLEPPHLLEPAYFTERAPSGISLRPFLTAAPSTNNRAASYVAPFKVNKIDSSPALPMPGVLAQPVDETRYKPVDERELAGAQLARDYGAPSPATIDSYSSGPLTPALDGDIMFHNSSFGSAMRLNSPWSPSWQVKNQNNVINTAHLSHAFDSPSGIFCGAGSACLQTCNGLQPPILRSSEPVLAGRSTSFHVEPSQLGTWPTLTPQAPPAFVRSSSESDAAVTIEPRHIRHLSQDRGQHSETEEVYEDSPRSSTSEQAAVRNSQDEYLLQMRLQGVSYKEIKRLGHFREAESTLRGRMRNLTKAKSERVRRPVWTPSDIKLLRRAVPIFTKAMEAHYGKTSRKLPWKKISEWIKENGGTYFFAPATCAKKWDQVHAKRSSARSQ